MAGERVSGKTVSEQTVSGKAAVVVANTRAWFVRRTPVFWLTLSVLSCVGLFLTWFWGAWSGGLDVAETCALLKGQKYDDAYRAEHWREPSRVFPLHNKCNASYDLVPAWVNPMLVLLAFLAVAGLIAAVWATAVRLRRLWQRRRPTSAA
ncbi:hypothetical protein [Streptomyces sp. NBC_00103]|uniref:hypothetical protein n=1 Tax=Streptomyces sp. NBC_00103 TaxID=2975653 RepID=UPI00225A2B62|nr:hypothetical protein [Streptomyces sp. NBC_00103]MCX5370292.1 hypothetical protein [Streptomyces sp. NBC_00103]